MKVPLMNRQGQRRREGDPAPELGQQGEQVLKEAAF